MDVKIRSVIVYPPVKDIDCDFGSYDLPYEISISLDGKNLRTDKRRLACCYESKNLLSMADSYDFLSEEGKKRFIAKFLSEYLAPLIWKRRWNSIMPKREIENIEFAMQRLKQVDLNQYQEFINFVNK